MIAAEELWRTARWLSLPSLLRLPTVVKATASRVGACPFTRPPFVSYANIDQTPGWLDRVEDACAAYERALELVHSDAERRFLEQRLTELKA
jgi:hypothetical protein